MWNLKWNPVFMQINRKRPRVPGICPCDLSEPPGTGEQNKQWFMHRFGFKCVGQSVGTYEFTLYSLCENAGVISDIGAWSPVQLELEAIQLRIACKERYHSMWRSKLHINHQKCRRVYALSS